MDAPSLDQLFGSRTRSRVLGWLLSHPGERYFVRQLAGILSEDPTNLSRELARLAALGILTGTPEGQQKYYCANASSPIYPELRSLFAKTSGIGAILRGALEPLVDRIQSAFLFGSVAAGREAQASDVDVMVIGAVSLEELVEVLGPFQNQLGREVNPSVYTAAEFRERLARGSHFLTSVLNGPKLFLIGSADELERLAEVRVAD
ncbi:MAG: nucleotidyltransferase domain-containing protein [Thermoanaerobaculia bacterium]